MRFGPTEYMELATKGLRLIFSTVTVFRHGILHKQNSHCDLYLHYLTRSNQLSLQSLGSYIFRKILSSLLRLYVGNSTVDRMFFATKESINYQLLLSTKVSTCKAEIPSPIRHET